MRTRFSQAWLNRNCTMVTPTQFIQTAGKSASGNAQSVRPVLCDMGSPAYGNAVVGSLIAGLLFLSSPSNVTWFVMAIDIDAIYRIVGARTFAHCSQESLKRTEPELDASSTVFGVVCAVPVIAAAFCCYIGSILGRFVCSWNAGVAGSQVSTAQQLTCDKNSEHPTVASAKPQSLVKWVQPKVTHHGEFFETAPRQNNGGSVGWNWIEFAKVYFSHCVNLLYRFAAWLGLNPCYNRGLGHFYFNTEGA